MKDEDEWPAAAAADCRCRKERVRCLDVEMDRQSRGREARVEEREREKEEDRRKVIQGKAHLARGTHYAGEKCESQRDRGMNGRKRRASDSCDARNGRESLREKESHCGCRAHTHLECRA